MFEVEYSSQSFSFLKKADKEATARILDKIEKLRENPIIQDTKTVEGYKEKLFRIRAGKYRVLYEVDYENRKIGIVKVDKRERAYNL